MKENAIFILTLLCNESLVIKIQKQMSAIYSTTCQFIKCKLSVHFENVNIYLLESCNLQRQVSISSQRKIIKPLCELFTLCNQIWHTIPHHMKSAITMNTLKPMFKKHISIHIKSLYL